MKLIYTFWARCLVFGDCRFGYRSSAVIDQSANCLIRPLRHSLTLKTEPRGPHVTCNSKMMLQRCLILGLSVCLLSLAKRISAAELTVRDLQADVAVLPANFSYRVTSPTVDVSGDDHFVSGTGLMFGARRSLARPGDAIGVIIGADIVSQTWTYSGGGWMWGVGGRLSTGLGWALTDTWTVVLEPGFSFGLDRLSLPVTSAGPGLYASGHWTGWDTRMSAGWQMSEQCVIRGIIGWMTTTFDQKEVGGVSSRLTPSGLLIGIGVSWQISHSPETLH